MTSTTIGGVLYTIINDYESLVGNDDMSNDGNAIIGQINKFLTFPKNVEISGKTRVVTAVGKRAFRCCRTIETIHIHKFIKILKYEAFDWCTNCHKITFARDSSLETLDYSAFYENQFISIILPKSLKNFVRTCLGGNHNLRSIYYLGTSNPGSSVDIFYKGLVPKNVYVGINYPYELFHTIKVTKKANILDLLYTRSLPKESTSFIIYLLIFIVVS